jgi:hypothetical protein
MYGNRDHSTVINSNKRVNDALDTKHDKRFDWVKEFVPSREKILTTYELFLRERELAEEYNCLEVCG